MKRSPAILIGLAMVLLPTRPVAAVAEPVFKVYPSGLAKIMLTDDSDRLTIWSEADDVNYELADQDGQVVAAGTMTSVRTLAVQSNGGDDSIAVGRGGLNAGLIVYSGAGDDVIELQGFDSSRGQEARVYLGSGDDRVVADFAAGTPTHFWVFADGGDDTVDVRNSSFDAERPGIFYVRGGPGDDTIATEGNSFGRVDVKASGGADDWTSTSDTFHAKLRYVSNGGDDTVVLDGTTVLAGAKVRVGGGADAVDLVSGDYVGSIVLDGGSGSADRLTIGASVTFDRPPIVSGFAV